MLPNESDTTTSKGETGVQNIDDIVAVDGIDVLFLGPYDTSQSIGIPGQVRDDRVATLMREVCDRAADAGKVVGTYADDPEMAREWIDVGAQYVAISVDGAILTRAFERIVEGVGDRQ